MGLTIKSIEIPPCPFCEGPPSVIVAKGLYPYGSADLKDDYGDDGLVVDAYVFCHECGASGPKYEDTIFCADDYHQVESKGVGLWMERTGKHRELYDSSAAAGLNTYGLQVIS